MSIESSKGIYSIYIQSFPYLTINIISNDYLTINQLNKFSRYINLGDLIVLLGSLDFVLGSVDLVIKLIFIKGFIAFLSLILQLSQV